MEAIVLLHHAAEALFRLYFAHVGGPACPRLEASRLTFGDEFKKKLESLLSSLDSETTTSDILKVFRGTDTYETAKNSFKGSEEQWLEQVQGMKELIHLVGARPLREGPLYNAAKRGLTIVAGERGMSLNAHTDLAIARHGPSNNFLMINRVSGRWESKTVWIEIDGAMAVTYLVSREIKALYGVARLRYLGQGGELLPNITPDLVRKSWMPAAKTDEATVVIDAMSEELAYYAHAPGIQN